MINCLLCGVGGQGTVLASRVLAQTAMEQGLFARTAETIGMAQRGGCVVSHVRIGSCASPMIPLGGADILIAFEPGEAVRALPYLKPDGVVVVNLQAVQPVTASLTGKRLDAEEMIAYLKTHAARVIVVDGQAVCMQCGTPKVLNTALLGAAIEAGALGFTSAQVAQVLLARLPEKVHAVNQKALALGALAAKGADPA
jgi:indolepyruvate ferredoxin oxidoreductase beta subunit